MNVAFFLVPKSEVVWIPDSASLRVAVELMQASGYAAVPMLDANGSYLGTVTEGDLLRRLVNSPNMRFADAERVRILDVPLRTNIRAVGIDAQMEELLSRAIEQNFVPVTDSRGVFVGIVRRREIIEYCAGVLSQRGGMRQESE